MARLWPGCEWSPRRSARRSTRKRTLGDALTGSGRLDEAQAELAAALAGFVAHADLRWEAYTRTSLGTLFLARGEPAAAREHLDRALAIFDR
ncbi:tetratricopeptide repeat protein, partial [Micromonospora sp. DH15]|nr:tetratricopeptide repeat protein [Micromonospora sp. DH15]